MALLSKDIQTMDDLFVHTLRDVYYAEQKIVKALPKMIEKASAQGLREGFETHLEETRGHVSRLEQVFEKHGSQAKAVDCPAIDGNVREAEELASEIGDKDVLDAGLAAAAQAVEHYEISRYGSLVAWASELGRDDCAELLQQTLDEEKATDAKLTKLAEERVNQRAA